MLLRLKKFIHKHLFNSKEVCELFQYSNIFNYNSNQIRLILIHKDVKSFSFHSCKNKLNANYLISFEAMELRRKLFSSLDIDKSEDYLLSSSCTIKTRVNNNKHSISIDLERVKIFNDKIIFMNFVLFKLFEIDEIRQEALESLMKLEDNIICQMLTSVYKHHSVFNFDINEFTLTSINKQSKKKNIEDIFNCFSRLVAEKQVN